MGTSRRIRARGGKDRMKAKVCPTEQIGVGERNNISSSNLEYISSLSNG
jgi:hypothetical protein